MLQALISFNTYVGQFYFQKNAYNQLGNIGNREYLAANIILATIETDETIGRKETNADCQTQLPTWIHIFRI